MMVSDDGTGGAAACSVFVNNLSTPAASGITVFSGIGNGIDIARGAAGVPNLTGSIAEVIVFAGILPPADLINLKAYLNTTRAYGIAVT
jgi:hypothetical protein